MNHIRIYHCELPSGNGGTKLMKLSQKNKTRRPDENLPRKIPHKISHKM